MQNTQFFLPDSVETRIIELGNNIYQNLGIKRWIEEISIFRKVETYFQICQIILPECNIDFYRIDNDAALTQELKIQAVINYLSSLLQSDLSHISGIQIGRGNPKHITNFLELFEELSNSIIQDEVGRVQSARLYRASSSEGSKGSYYTVMAINKEFQKDQYRPEEGEPNVQVSKQEERAKKNAHILPNPKSRQQEQEQSIGSSTDFPIKPIKKATAPKSTLKKVVKQQENRPSSINTRKKQKKQIKNQQRLNSKYHQQNNQFLNLVKQIYESEQALNNNYEASLRKLYSKQFRQLEDISQKNKNIIEKQARLRKKVIQNKLTERNHLLKSLEGGEYLKKAVKNLYHKEEQLRKQARQKDHDRQLKRMEDLMDFDEFDQLFRVAIDSNSSKPSHRNK